MEIGFREAVRTFVHGFAFTRSFTHPYLVEAVGEHGWLLRDAPRKRPEYRSEEIVLTGVAPEAVLETVRAASDRRPRICVLLPDGEDDAPLRAAMKAGKARLMATEGFFVHDLSGVTSAPGPLPQRRVATAAEVERIAKAAGRRVVLPEHLGVEPPPMREYAAWDGDRPVGWVGSVDADGCGWVTWMFVEEAYRRRGIARALMAQMLADDVAQGFRSSVLLASQTGGKLYPTVGYRRIGTLFMYTSPKA